MKPGQIALVNLKLKTKSDKIIFLNDVIFSENYETKRTILKYNVLFDRRLISKTKLKEDLIIIEIKVIKNLGFRNKLRKYTEVKKNEEIRNKITGAYE